MPETTIVTMPTSLVKLTSSPKIRTPMSVEKRMTVYCRAPESTMLPREKAIVSVSCPRVAQTQKARMLAAPVAVHA